MFQVLNSHMWLLVRQYRHRIVSSSPKVLLGIIITLFIILSTIFTYLFIILHIIYLYIVCIINILYIHQYYSGFTKKEHNMDEP